MNTQNQFNREYLNFNLTESKTGKNFSFTIPLDLLSKFNGELKIKNNDQLIKITKQETVYTLVSNKNEDNKVNSNDGFRFDPTFRFGNSNQVNTDSSNGSVKFGTNPDSFNVPRVSPSIFSSILNQSSGSNFAQYSATSTTPFSTTFGSSHSITPVPVFSTSSRLGESPSPSINTPPIQSITNSEQFLYHFNNDRSKEKKIVKKNKFGNYECRSTIGLLEGLLEHFLFDVEKKVYGKQNYETNSIDELSQEDIHILELLKLEYKDLNSKVDKNDEEYIVVEY